MSKQIIDPEYERWKRKYPKFPGIDKCVELLRSPNVRGAWIDIVCSEIEQYSKKDPSELIEAVNTAENSEVRNILLGILEGIASPEAVSVFAKILSSDKMDEHDYAISGLRRIDTKEARTVLWNAGVTIENESA